MAITVSTSKGNSGCTGLLVNTPGSELDTNLETNCGQFVNHLRSEFFVRFHELVGSACSFSHVASISSPISWPVTGCQKPDLARKTTLVLYSVLQIGSHRSQMLLCAGTFGKPSNHSIDPVHWEFMLRQVGCCQYPRQVHPYLTVFTGNNTMGLE